MPEKLAFPGRKFSIWAYKISHHSRLLLRSTRSEEVPTRIDVLIHAVTALCLPCRLEGLEIEEVSAEEVPGLSSVAAEELLLARSVYRVSGSNGPVGFVVGGAVTWHEDEGRFTDPSALMPDVAM